jgi:hypothetical protein
MSAITCPTCHATYSGNQRGPWHCAGCHRTYSGMSMFDRFHRIGPDGQMVHLDPAGASGVVREDAQGASVWKSSQPRPEWWKDPR